MSNEDQNTDELETGNESRNIEDDADLKGAGVKYPPPIVFLMIILLGGGLDYLWPIGMGVSGNGALVGGVLILVGATIAILVNAEFKRRNTAIEPWKPTTSIVTDGFYAWSRNPIYLGFCMLSIGIGIALNSFWIFISFIPGALAVQIIAINKEEEYLEAKFGQEYLDYKNKVRRWL
ncbi:MAG: isoprenylcysteine carboxylmethyltransferase family protein [Gammaproteobacteria bacterium]|jgi:protein-S-isoprenylcysteine O-methyltransferase Ste14|nr:isoprenylcysteine carboxylmethyltransferase family protein [Gammaproteobacteria bacterium]MBT3860640.1 isoprenylcysteine carboxylmethyltransferase family protein [Gammaproteobacteria bacterium]MBT3988777.1 isoprenylcysteine carboxylmethyltransferase family protein [Gammaproteobacteria bacterium]MBT4256849.1 isoprenylcysteine carboxylmethyltransferase family protein [Gammaproteobacteria bacterium]MBT4582640.1 isoprenylcysteine carboxylmethyltransferase family protein [Gammaproteobacteria bact